MWKNLTGLWRAVTSAPSSTLEVSWKTDYEFNLINLRSAAHHSYAPFARVGTKFQYLVEILH